MIRRFFLFFFTLISFCCCKTDFTQHFDRFDMVLPLKAKKVEIPPVLLYPRSVFICGSNLVIFNEKVDTLFRVFRLPEVIYQYGFGTRGEGPNDFNLPAIKAVNYDVNGFTMVDIKELKHVRVEETGYSVQQESFLYPFDYFNGLTQLTDSTYCCDADFEQEKEFMFLDSEGGFKVWGEYPESAERLKSILNRNQAYSKILVAKPDGTKFAAFYQSVRRYRIFDTRGNLEHDIVLDIFPGELLPDEKSENRYIHTIAAHATDEYLYTLNLDMTVEEISQRKSFPSIQVFSWEGKPVAQFLLDHFISAFTVDYAQNKIYGVFAEDESSIYVFKIPTL